MSVAGGSAARGRITVRAVFRRDFWTFRALNALFGALVTVGSGLAQVGVGDALRDRIAALDVTVRDTDEKIRTIDAAVFEFKLFESDSTLVQVLSMSGAIQEVARNQVRAITIMNRRHAFLVILSELYPQAVVFKQKLDEYQRLSAGSIAWDKALADQMIEMESTSIQAAHALQQTLINRKYDALTESQDFKDRLARFAVIGFTVQQLALLMVLFGSLIADHAARPEAGPAASA